MEDTPSDIGQGRAGLSECSAGSDAGEQNADLSPLDLVSCKSRRSACGNEMRLTKKELI